MTERNRKLTRAEKVEHLLDVAEELFNRNGFHGSGIDQIIAESGVAKTTLYRHFKSKEDLIVAVLRRIDARFMESMRESVVNSKYPVQEKLLATFDYLEQWFREPTFYGCTFVSAINEYNDSPNAVFKEAQLHKELAIAYFEELARAGRYKHPKQLAIGIHLLHEGATATANLMGKPTIARDAKACAKLLLAAHSK